MGVGGVGSVTRPRPNESVGGNPGRDEEGRDPDAEASEIISDIVSIRCTGECQAVFRGGNTRRRHDVVGEAAVLVEVDNHEAAGVFFEGIS